MSLRQVLTHADTCLHDLLEQMRIALLPRLLELRQLSRPVRRHSAYPTPTMLLTTLSKLLEANREAVKLVDVLLQQMQAIRKYDREQRKQQH
jgi:hypothetical protein